MSNGPLNWGGNGMTKISASLVSWQFAWQMAQREMRGSLRKFRVFLGALLLGVAAIGTVGSVAESMRDGINDNARILLAGDLEISSLHTPPNDEIITTAKAFGKVSKVIQMRAMLQAGDRRKLVELKAVDEYWPLVGMAERQQQIGCWLRFETLTQLGFHRCHGRFLLVAGLQSP